MKEFEKIYKLIELNQIPLLIFFISLFVFISSAGTRIFFTDEGIILNQFYNLIHGSLALKVSTINITSGIYMIVGNDLYGRFSYFLLILSLIPYYMLHAINVIYGAHLFLLQLWAICGGVIVYLIAKTRKLKYALFGGSLSYLLLITLNLIFFKPIYFPKWGELLSIEFTNIIISSFLVVFVYLLFKKFFGNKTGIFASLFVIFATPISFYAITLKHHSLTLFLTILAFYFFYIYQEKKDNKYMYSAYALAGLCIWTRILDGTVLFASLYIIDLVIFRRSIRYILNIFIILIISLIPFFSLNYLIMGNPLSIAESTPMIDKSITLPSSNDFITLIQDPDIAQHQNELLNKLGYTKVHPQYEWNNTIVSTLFLKSINTFGIFLVSPLLIIALAFVIEIIRKKIKLNTMDKFFGLYIIILFSSYILLNIFLNTNALLHVIIDTPVVLENRYLLIIYIILLYFVVRIDKIKHIIENKYMSVASLYITILILSFIYFIIGFPISFISVYYSAAIITSIFLIFLLLINLFIENKRSVIALFDNLLLVIIAFSLAEASALMLFYYWVTSMTYISPSQNYTIVPVVDIILKQMYNAVL
jgi:4-amino-4-deoxy-L-arabinose transferase-like glycosyltransferase